MNLRQALIASLGFSPAVIEADPYGIRAALAARKAARPARQDAARRASETRKARA